MGGLYFNASIEALLKDCVGFFPNDQRSEVKQDTIKNILGFILFFKKSLVFVLILAFACL